MAKKKIKNNVGNVFSFEHFESKKIFLYTNSAPDIGQEKIENIKYNTEETLKLGDFFGFLVEFKKSVNNESIETVFIMNRILNGQTPTSLNNEDVWDFVATPGVSYGSQTIARYLHFNENTFTIDNCINEGRDSGSIIANDYLIILNVVGILK